MQLRLQDIEAAWHSRDPALPELFCQLVNQPDPTPSTPPREGAMTFDQFIRDIQSPGFHQKYETKEQQAEYRIKTLALLQSDQADVPLSPRLQSHQLLMTLWEDNSYFARQCLLQIIAQVPLKYGPWRALKQIFKQAEARHDTEILGALAARFDTVSAQYGRPEVSKATLRYLCRRAWRYLRHTGHSLPVCYADYAVDVLAWYDDKTTWESTWIANHLFYHETHHYSKNHFHVSAQARKTVLKYRAFTELWQRTPRPLFNLLERARAEKVRQFAIEALKQDFRAALREVQAEWVARLVTVQSRRIDEFIVWILDNVPRFQQADFRALGLHEAVLRLFDSPADEARTYAANYARTHARDLTVAHLIRLANNDNEAVRKLASDLLLAKDPRKEVGLEAWGVLLDMAYSRALAGKVLRKHFGSRELTPTWFVARFIATLHYHYEEYEKFEKAFDSIQSLLADLYSLQKLGQSFFYELVAHVEKQDFQTCGHDDIINFALHNLRKLEVNTLDPSFLQRMLLHPAAYQTVAAWIDEGILSTDRLPTAFFKSLAYQPDWDNNTFIAELRQSDLNWISELVFDEAFAEQVLAWLSDVRRFKPAELGFDWLMQLVERSELHYHEMAVNLLNKAFTPADFAPNSATSATTDEPDILPEPVDLQQATFLFTGKLATMTRNQAQQQVEQANGVQVNSVTAKLDYLVIGDEGSPLYGEGRKGSKQVKAEKLIAEGAQLQIISETAFLQMLAGKQREFSADATIAGCERLWGMATRSDVPDDAPLAKFALKYLQLHHPQICLKRTDRPVDPGAEIPAEFLTFERVKPLFTDNRLALRRFALELAKWELVRWSPPLSDLISLCEAPYTEVRQFIADALLQAPSADNQAYRLDVSAFPPATVYSFCESQDPETRELGMTLIQQHAHLRVPAALFCLTESPDRKVRNFVVWTLWSLYRQRATTTGWQPTLPPQPSIGKKAQQTALDKQQQLGTGAPARPSALPADYAALQQLLRQVLFEIPPPRPAKSHVEDKMQIAHKLRPLPARKAKLNLIETLRDIALIDRPFADTILPLLEEFMLSRGRSEQAACLVAVTRIKQQQTEV